MTETRNLRKTRTGTVVSIDIEIDKESTFDRKKKMEEKLKKLIEKNE